MDGNLNKLSKEWEDIDSIVLYGAGTVSKICQPVFQKIDMKIPFVIDRDADKQEETWNGIPIIDYEKAIGQLQNRKIVVMTAHTAYNEISQFLTEQGMKEFQDYCSIGQFICEWFWKVKGMNCLYQVDMTITTKCTFRCKNCNMFIPYHKEKRDYTFEELKRNVDLLFSRIDYIAYFVLLGGEPTLNPALKDILQYIGEQYREKCGRLTYSTNGSVVPSDEMFLTMKKYDVHVLITDYTREIPYQDKFEQLREKLEQFNILHDIRYSPVWVDFGFPTEPIRLNEEQLQEHLQCCRPEWGGLNDGKFYFCNVAWSAEKSGHYKLKPEDYIVLQNVQSNDKEACHEIVELSRGTCSFCKVCGGCGSDNTKFVPVGIQL